MYSNICSSLNPIISIILFAFCLNRIRADGREATTTVDCGRNFFNIIWSTMDLPLSIGENSSSSSKIKHTPFPHRSLTVVSILSMLNSLRMSLKVTDVFKLLKKLNDISRSRRLGPLTSFSAQSFAIL